jgi:hAT family C-terminal dimerisation region
MLARALFLRKAIDQFVGEEDQESDKDGRLSMYKLTKKEWDQAGVIVTILLPFKLTSVRLQATKRPGIDSVFWEYESLFNKIDSIKSTFTQPEYRAKEWIQELHAGVEKLSEKLQEYYSRTEHAFVYSDACILEPQGKLILFKQDRFAGDPNTDWASKYKQECRERFVNNYETTPIIEADNPRKHPRDDSSDEDEVGDYRSYLHRHSRQLTISQNELDRYIDTPPPAKKIKTLEYWKNHDSDFPRLKHMVRDTLAVPATGAGVERMFSKSGKVATWGRAQLNSITITDTMLYKEFLSRIGQPLDEQAERRRAERKKAKKKNPKPVAQEASDSEDDEEENPALIAWELEWWAKEGAAIIH